MKTLVLVIPEILVAALVLSACASAGASSSGSWGEKKKLMPTAEAVASGQPGKAFAEPAQPAQTKASEEEGSAIEINVSQSPTSTDDKKEFVLGMKLDLAKIQKDIEAMQKQLSKASGKLRTELETQLKGLEGQRGELNQKLEAATETSGRAWGKMRVGLEKAMTEFLTAFDEAKKEIQEEKKSKANSAPKKTE